MSLPTPRHGRALPVILVALTATGPLAIDMYLPSIPDMAVSLNTTEGAVQISLMTFFIGLMLGQLAYGPLSDKFGRKPLIYLGMAIFVLGSIGCALAGDITQLQWLRFVQGLGGSIGMVIAFAIVKDAFTGPAIGKNMALILAALGLCPILAPMLGNVLQELVSWRATFWALALYGMLLVLGALVLLPETRDPVARKSFVLGRTFRIYLKILGDRSFITFALALCAAQAGFFGYIAGSASVFISEYSLSPMQFSLLFAVNALGLVVAAQTTPRLQQTLGPVKLYRIMITAYFVVMALVVGTLASGHGNIFILSAGLFVAIALLGGIMPTGSLLALMNQREFAGTASALMGSMQFAAGAIITGISGMAASMGGLGLGLIMLACASVAALICWTAIPRQAATA